MHITHISDTYLPLMGGIETQVAGLARQQAAAGHKVQIITTTPAGPGGHGLNTEHDDGVTVHRIAARIPGGYPIHPRSTRHVSRLLAASPPDVVHLHMGVLAPTSQFALRAVVRQGLSAVLTVHSVWGAAERWFRWSDAVVRWSRWPVVWSAVSELTATPLRRILSPGATLAILHNGLDLQAWAVPRTERAQRPEGNAIHLVAATRFAPRKRVLPMLAAIRQAAQALPAGSLFATIAGDGPQLASARRFVADHGLEDMVSFPGRLSATDLKRLYARADVFVAPAIEESFGIAALEAQAAGLAVITRQESGIAERLTDGVNGLIVADDDAMARAFIRLATDDGTLDAIIAHNREVPATCDWATVLKEVDAAYTQAIDLRSSAR